MLQRPAIAAFKIATGKRAWLVGAGTQDEHGRVVPPTIAGGLAYPGGRGKAPARPAVNLKTGRVAYRTAPGGAQGAKVVVGSGMVVAASGNKIRAYRVRNGHFVWQATRTNAALTVLGGRLIVSSGGPSPPMTCGPASACGRCGREPSAGSRCSRTKSSASCARRQTTALRSWSAIDGHTRWNQRIGGSSDGFTDPAMVNGVVLVGWWTPTKSSLIGARRTSGRRLATLNIGVGRMGSPVVVNDTVLVSTGNILHALRTP